MKDCSSRVCLICGKSYIKLGNHILQAHNLKQQEYYDIYLKKECDGVCKICGNSTNFIRLHEGYRQYCSKACMYVDSDRSKKIAQTCMKSQIIKY